MFQTGSNEWKTYSQWPPTNLTTERKLYFHSNGKLSFEAPTSDSDKDFDSYVSDPANPVPTASVRSKLRIHEGRAGQPG
jgi:predicted acyl esterase